MINKIIISEINLEWTEWKHWHGFEIDLRFKDGVRVPESSGVYEAKYLDSEERLTIGKASNLRMRIKQGLVKGKIPHSAGDKIRKNEDTSNIVIRWAQTERPSCVEEELHKKHIQLFGDLPKYTKST